MTSAASRPTLADAHANVCTSQHFQGLRRSQQKLEANGSSGDNNLRKIDPTENPITRRPGPGRGRPRKSIANAAAVATAATAGSAPDASPQTADGADPSQGQDSQTLAQQISEAQQISQHELPSLPPQPDMNSSVGPAPTPMMESTPPQMHPPPPDHSVEMQSEAVFPQDASEEPDEHTAKRAKLEENHDPALNDEAILSALAAHNNPDLVQYDAK